METSYPVDKVYSLTSSPSLPTINIFVPSSLKATPWGLDSWEERSKLSTKEAPVILFEVAPFETVNVASSFTVPMLSAATGALFVAFGLTSILI